MNLDNWFRNLAINVTKDIITICFITILSLIILDLIFYWINKKLS